MKYMLNLPWVRSFRNEGATTFTFPNNREIYEVFFTCPKGAHVVNIVAGDSVKIVFVDIGLLPFEVTARGRLYRLPLWKSLESMCFDGAYVLYFTKDQEMTPIPGDFDILLSGSTEYSAPG